MLVSWCLVGCDFVGDAYRFGLDSGAFVFVGCAVRFGFWFGSALFVVDLGGLIGVAVCFICFGLVKSVLLGVWWLV